jgi:DNA-binding CsgD family transcriptional regulator
VTDRDNLDRLALRAFGYDPDDPVPRDEDGARVIPEPLLRALGIAPAPAVEKPSRTAQLIAANEAKRQEKRLWATRAIGALLTRREMEVLLLTADGLNYVEIAPRLFLSPETVRSHTKTLRRKLQAKTMAQAVAVAFRRGMIE